MADKLPVPSKAPSPADQQSAKQALQFFDDNISRTEPWAVEGNDAEGNPKTIVVPALVNAIFLDALAQTAAGQAIALVTMDMEVTTQQAAAILKVSRPFVVSLVENGELAARQVGNRLRLPLQDVLDYKAAHAPKRRMRPG